MKVAAGYLGLSITASNEFLARIFYELKAPALGPACVDKTMRQMFKIFTASLACNMATLNIMEIT